MMSRTAAIVVALLWLAVISRCLAHPRRLSGGACRSATGLNGRALRPSLTPPRLPSGRPVHSSPVQPCDPRSRPHRGDLRGAPHDGGLCSCTGRGSSGSMLSTSPSTRPPSAPAVSGGRWRCCRKRRTSSGFRSAREIPAGPVTLDVTYRGRIQDTETSRAIFRRREGANWALSSRGSEALGAGRAYPLLRRARQQGALGDQLWRRHHSPTAVCNPPGGLRHTDGPWHPGGHVPRVTPPLPSAPGGPSLWGCASPWWTHGATGDWHGSAPRGCAAGPERRRSAMCVEHTAPLLAWLEDCFGNAVPRFAAARPARVLPPHRLGFGAMEQDPGLDHCVNQRLAVARR